MPEVVIALLTAALAACVIVGSFAATVQSDRHRMRASKFVDRTIAGMNRVSLAIPFHGIPRRCVLPMPAMSGFEFARKLISAAMPWTMECGILNMSVSTD